MFLSDPGIPGVRSMGPDVSNSVQDYFADLTDVTPVFRILAVEISILVFTVSEMACAPDAIWGASEVREGDFSQSRYFGDIL